MKGELLADDLVGWFQRDPAGGNRRLPGVAANRVCQVGNYCKYGEIKWRRRGRVPLSALHLKITINPMSTIKYTTEAISSVSVYVPDVFTKRKHVYLDKTIT